jgi:hypothetical protein
MWKAMQDFEDIFLEENGELFFKSILFEED